MPLYTDIASLSQTPASNAADGTTDAPSTIDNNMNLLASFIAKLRDGTGFSAGAVVQGLGHTPVIRGEIAGTDTNPVNVGYNPTISKMVVASNGNNFSNQWPIDITGNASSLGGAGSAEYVKRWSNDAVRVGWNGSQVVIEINGNSFGGIIPMPVPWTMVNGRPSDLGSFSNGPGYATVGYTDGSYLKREGAALSLGNIGTGGLYVNISGFGAVSWGVTPSDARLKTGIVPTAEDSLSKIAQIDFKQFRFRQDVTETPVDDGRLHRLGVIAQEIEAIDPAWLQEGGTWKAPNQQALLYAALHAIQQLEAKVAALEARP